MTLNELIQADALAIVEDTDTGRADTIVFTAPDGSEQTLSGLYNAIGVEIDPGTGLQVPGTTAEVTVGIGSLSTIPIEGWKVEVYRGGSVICTGYVIGDGMPDRTRGIVTYHLRGASYA